MIKFIKLSPNSNNNAERNSYKIPIGKWKDEANQFSFDDVKQYPNLGVVIPQGIVVVDIDDEKMGEKVLNYVNSLGIKTLTYKTGKGRHLWFKDPSSTLKSVNVMPCYGGISVDYKANESGYVAIKLIPDGGFRIKELDDFRTLLEGLNKLDNLPTLLTPLSRKIKENEVGFGALDNWNKGQRNENYFEWFKVLWKRDVSNQKIIYSLFELIDRFICNERYFKSESDLKSQVYNWKQNWENYAKEQKIELKPPKDKSPADKKKSEIEKALDILRSFPMKRFDNILYVKIDNKWILEEKIKDWTVKHISYGKLSPNSLNNVIDLLVRMVKDEDRIESIEHKILKLKNGCYDYRKDAFIEGEYDEFLPFPLNVSYDKNAYSKEVEELLNYISCNDYEVKRQLIQLLAFGLQNKNKISKLVLLFGNGSNGKSTYLNFIRNIIGRNNVDSLKLHDLEERFNREQLVGKLLNIGDDISGHYLNESKSLKTLISNERIKFDRKNRDAIDVGLSQMKYIFSANKIPRTNDKSFGWLRRLLLVPMDLNMKGKQTIINFFNNFNENFSNDENAKSYLFNLAIKELVKWEQEKDYEFAKSKRADELIKKYEEDNDLFVGWWNEEGESYKSMIRRNDEEVFLRTDLFYGYTNWVTENYGSTKMLEFRGFKDRVKTSLFEEIEVSVFKIRNPRNHDNLDFEIILIENEENKNEL